MRGSFGGGGMGGGSGGGGMLKAVHRAVRAGVGGAPAEPFSHSNTATSAARKPTKSFKKQQSNAANPSLTLAASSSVNSAHNDVNNNGFSSSVITNPLSAAAAASSVGHAWSSPMHEPEWECVDGSEDEEMGYVLNDDIVFGSVPSRDEVQHAVSALQQVFGSASLSCFANEKPADGSDISVRDPSRRGSVSSVESELDWIEPSLHLCNSRMLQSHGSGRVYDAFHLLQTEPSVQRMVLSLSSDKAVWDAVLNNEVVQELRGSLNQEHSVGNKLQESSGEPSDDSDPIKDILSWVFVNTAAKIKQLVDRITRLFNHLVEPLLREKAGGKNDPFDDKLRTSLLLSVVVLLVVVITRAQSA